MAPAGRLPLGRPVKAIVVGAKVRGQWIGFTPSTPIVLHPPTDIVAFRSAILKQALHLAPLLAASRQQGKAGVAGGR